MCILSHKGAKDLMNTIFYTVLNMSITAAVIGVILSILRIFLKNTLPKFVMYSLWSVVLFRMLIPFSLGSKLSLINIIKGYFVKIVEIAPLVNQLPDSSMLNYIKTASVYFPVEYKTKALQNIFSIASAVWLLGTIIAIAITLTLYFLISFELSKSVLFKDDLILTTCKEALKIKNNVKVYTSSVVATPIALGIFNSRIIIPTQMDEKTLEFIFLHELIYINRKDNLWRLIGIFAACLHWFNPFTWFFLYLCAEDMELACDSTVLKHLKYSQRKEYTKALASTTINQQTAFTAFGGRAIKQRILYTLNYKSVSLAMSAISAVFCSLLILIFLTNPI